MKSTHVQSLIHDFCLGEYVSIVSTIEGILNKNYILTTREGTFFVKEVRGKGVTHLPFTMYIERLMLDRGIPAICMRKTRDGSYSVEYDGMHYTVYPYIQSDRNHVYSETDYTSMGEMLGRIHAAGSVEGLTVTHFPVFAEKTKEDEHRDIEQMERIAMDLNSRSELTSVERSFCEYIALKVSCVPTLHDYEALPSTSIVHGDYHAGNLLISQKDRAIIGICDWEKAEIAPRAYELARSLLYICFPAAYDAQTALTFSHAFLAGYQRISPISRTEFIQGMHMRLRRMVVSTWIEKKYFMQNDIRANHFVPHEMQLIRDFFLGNMADAIEL